MMFSDTTNKLGLVQDIDFLLFGSSATGSAYAIADKTRNINNAYDKAATQIMKADGHWEWDDDNKSDLPIATSDLVADQQDYTISGATFLKVLKIEIKDANGNWEALAPITLDDKRNRSITDYKKTAGTPLEYDKLGNSLFLYPKPSYDSTGGFKIFYQRNVTHFSASDTTAVPGFAEIFHRLLSLGAAMDYAVANTMDKKIRTLTTLIEKMETDLIDFYSNRGHDEKVTLKLQHEDYGQGEGDIMDFGNINFS